MTNTNKLKGAIVAAGYTQKQVAEKLGISGTALNNKITNRSPFLAAEIFVLEELLNIKNLSEMFFCGKVH